MSYCRVCLLGAVLVGGAAGAVCRVEGNKLIMDMAGGLFPLGILIINIAGSLLMGLLLGTLARRGDSELWNALLGTGFLGGFTTFSSFALDTVYLWEADKVVFFLLNIILNTGLGIFAACVGWKWSQTYCTKRE